MYRAGTPPPPPPTGKTGGTQGEAYRIVYTAFQNPPQFLVQYYHSPTAGNQPKTAQCTKAGYITPNNSPINVNNLILPHPPPLCSVPVLPAQDAEGNRKGYDMLIEIDERILDKGNNIEVKKNRDGQIVVMEVKKVIVQKV